MSTTSFNNYRFKGFKYQDQSHKYWDFKDQVNADESKVLIRINRDNVFSYINYNNGWRNYVLKLDRNHCMFLKNWQYFDGYYGAYVVLDKKYFKVADAREPFDDMASDGDMETWDDALKIAKDQQKMISEDNLVLVAKD
ncbi:hypothetical protein [uncultured Lactobacillus sp.]|uniref:hypothetical protein n=1 Tax=uncultured Lactobacillus sp. TaxID=153152 RepID=UPI0025E495F1|nr:hypothetical protein [uncultured Lactobacillus sp.]